MRMLEVCDGTWAPAQLPKDPAWETHMAPGTSIHNSINSPARAAVNTLNRLTTLFHIAVLLVMAHILDSSTGCACSGEPPSPLCGVCPPGFADLNKCTHTGCRCTLLACFEPLPGFHFSHSRLCSFNSPHSVRAEHIGGLNPSHCTQTEIFSNVNSPLRTSDFSVCSSGSRILRPAPVAMPRLCQRM